MKLNYLTGNGFKSRREVLDCFLSSEIDEHQTEKDECNLKIAVKSGRVKISYLSLEGKEIIVTILHSGDIYSLHSEANATVLEPAEILWL